MTAPKEALVALSARTRTAVSGATVRPFLVAAGEVVRLARHILAEYLRSGWILVELAYVLALYFFAFGYPFEPPFFFQTANGGLGLLSVCATLLLVARAIRPATAQPAIAHASRRGYIAGLMLAAAGLRLISYLALLALVLLSHRFVNAPFSALFAGSLGLLAFCVVLAALALALSPAFTPRPARRAVSPDRPGNRPSSKPGDDNNELLYAIARRRHLILLAWLTAALYSYTTTDTLAAIFFAWRLPLLPLAASFEMGMTGVVGWGGLLSLVLDAGYVVGLVLLASRWLAWRPAAPAAVMTTEAQSQGDGAEPAHAPTSLPDVAPGSKQRTHMKEQATASGATHTAPKAAKLASAPPASASHAPARPASPRRGGISSRARTRR